MIVVVAVELCFFAMDDCYIFENYLDTFPFWSDIEFNYQGLRFKKVVL